MGGNSTFNTREKWLITSWESSHHRHHPRTVGHHRLALRREPVTDRTNLTLSEQQRTTEAGVDDWHLSFLLLFLNLLFGPLPDLLLELSDLKREYTSGSITTPFVSTYLVNKCALILDLVRHVEVIQPVSPAQLLNNIRPQEIEADIKDGSETLLVADIHEVCQ